MHRPSSWARWSSRSRLIVLQSLAGLVSACTLAPAKDLGGGQGPGDAMCGGVAGGGASGGAGGAAGMMSLSGDGGGGAGAMSSRAGALTTGTGVTVSADPTNVVTPASCNSNPAATPANPNAIDMYSPGYAPSADVLAQVKSALGQMSLTDKASQMRGTRYGGATSLQYTDIQRSYDTSTIRGFRYRDASRGMNLGEDMAGALPHAGFENGQDVGYSTAFPVSMARGASFDLDLEYAIGEAIADEMQAAGETLLLAPCMNTLRHPLWGRAQETYGEDSYHIGRMASAMAVGVQRHIAANAKHFMAYDIENHRNKNNAQIEDEQALRETYGRHFRMVVQDGGVASVMASYNLINGTKATQNFHVLTEVLRNDFGFKGFVLSDWWAMPNLKPDVDVNVLRNTAVEAVKAGLDVELPWALNYGQLENIVTTKSGLTAADIDAAAARVLEQKFRFKADPLTGQVGLGSPTTRYRSSQIMCNSSHQQLAEQAAVESMVLLKNDHGTLPIAVNGATKVAVLGATVPYHTGTNTDDTSDKTGGIVNFAKDVRTGDLGSSRVFHAKDDGIGPYAGIAMTAPEGVTVTAGSSAADAADADFVVVVAGLTAQDEGEEYTKAGDRSTFALDAKQTDPKHPEYQNIQNELIQSVAALGKPMVVVLEGGSVIDMPWLSSVPAVVMAWYPGERGGAALGKLLWGRYQGGSYNFSGKLPFTWSQLGDYPTFDGFGTTSFPFYIGYRHFDRGGITPTFAFGAGLSYTTFEYRKLQLDCADMSKGAVMHAYVNVANTGRVAGDEIVMVFASFPDTTARRPAKELKAFARVSLQPGEEKQVVIPLRLSDLDYFQVDAPGASSGKWVVESGRVEIKVGGSATTLPLTATVQVEGYTQ